MEKTSLANATHLKPGESVKINGWAEDIKILKNMMFIIMRDSTGRAQITVKRNVENYDEISEISRESVIEVSGVIPEEQKSKSFFEIIAEKINIVNRAESPLPLPVSDRVEVDFETRFNNRFLDLRRKENGDIFRAKASLLWGIRTFLHDQGFTEVQTPKTVSAATEGGAELFSIQYFEKKAYLNQSPQLYKEMLIASGIERVFEVGPAFRAEEHNTPRHLNEFTSIDIEMAFSDHNDAMFMLENAIANGIKNMIETIPGILERTPIKEVQKTPFPKITHKECIDILRDSGFDINYDEDLNNEALKIIGQKFNGFYFIIEWPEKVRPFYTSLLETDKSRTKSYDLQFKELELTSGAQRIHDPRLLEKRIIEKGLNPKDFEFYIRTFRYGMPPHAGWGLGLERLTQVVLGLNNIREASLFPRDRTRIFP